MKTFIVALLVLAILLTGIFIYSGYIEKIDHNLTKIINNIQEYVSKENWNMSEKELKKLIDTWKKDEKILAMFNDHEDLDKIRLAIGELSESVHHKDDEHSQKAIEDFKVLLERLVKNESFDLENILKLSQSERLCHIM